MSVTAQSFPEMNLNGDFEAQVKSVDEFIQRFNGDETHPELKNAGRLLNISALFDYKKTHKELSDTLLRKNAFEFVQEVVKGNVKIRLTDAELYAVADITALICDKPVSLSLVLQSQTYNKEWTRWAIVGVKGLEKSGVIDLKSFYGISPVEHETHFMSIGDLFQYNTPEIMGYRGKDTTIDELSVLLTMGKMDKVRVVNVHNLTMHCLEIPNYIFTINEEGQSGQNSGWLISHVMKADEDMKQKYKTNLLGK